MENRDPILLNRFRDESHRVRDVELARQFRLSLGLVALLTLATAGTLVSMTRAAPTTANITEQVVSRPS